MTAGRPPYQPSAKDRTYVESLASYGVPEEDIARVIGVARATLLKHYRDQIDNGALRANAQVAGFLFTACKKGSVPAMMFWLRCRAKWSEPRVSAEEQLGKKEVAVVAARQLDIRSPFESVIAKRLERQLDVGSQLPGLGRPADERPVPDSRSAAA